MLDSLAAMEKPITLQIEYAGWELQLRAPATATDAPAGGVAVWARTPGGDWRRTLHGTLPAARRRIEARDAPMFTLGFEAQPDDGRKRRFGVADMCACGAATKIVDEDWEDFDYGSGTGVAYALSRCANGHEKGHADHACIPRSHKFYRDDHVGSV